MKKRGQLTFWMMISVVGAILVAYVLANIAVEWGTGSIFVKSRLARQVALEINSLYAVPGNSYIINENPYNFSISLKDNEVRVFQDNDMIVGTASYLFIKSGNQKINLNLRYPEYIVISKINGKILLSDKVDDFFKDIIKAQNFKDSKILIFANPQLDINAYELAELIVRGYNKIFQEIDYGYKPMDSYDAVLSMHSTADDFASIYVNKKSPKYAESLGLAKIIEKELSKSSIQTELNQIEQLDGNLKEALDNDKLAVYIKIPSSSKRIEIGKSIYSALEGYSK